MQGDFVHFIRDQVFDLTRSRLKEEIQYEHYPVGCDLLIMDSNREVPPNRPTRPPGYSPRLGAKLRLVGSVLARKSGAKCPQFIQDADHEGAAPWTRDNQELGRLSSEPLVGLK
jgi:hypothetical protein